MKQLLIIIFLSLILLPLASAQVQTLGTFKENSCVELKQICSNCTYVNLTRVSNPDSTISLTGQFSMTKTNTNYNYTYCNTNSSGQYIVDWVADPNAVITAGSYDFFITPSGQPQTTSRTDAISRSIYFFLIFGIITFIGAFWINKLPIKITFILVSSLLLLTTINLLDVSLQDEVINPSIANFFNSFSTISFILFRFIWTLLISMWIIVAVMSIMERKKSKRGENGY